MKIGFVGLGKMGFLLAKQMVDAGIEVIGWDLDPTQGRNFEEAGGKIAKNLPEMMGMLDEQKRVWLMVPAGIAVDQVIDEIAPLMGKKDIIIDGGNSYFKDSIRRNESLKELGIDFLDCGTSGGLEGAADGACLMVGGEKSVFTSCENLFELLAMKQGFLYCGGSGSGHFVKMIHNGIEYGMMQSIAEGFELLHKSDYDLDLEQVARLWTNGSVIRGWLMDLTTQALQKDPGLKEIKGIMHNSGEGKWTAQTAIEMEVPAPVITQSLQMRFRSKQTDTFSGKIVAALRNEFGGHAVEKDD